MQLSARHRTIFTVLSLTAFGGIVSAALTVGQLQMDTIDSLAGLSPNQVCVEASYDLANRYIATTMSLPLDQYVQVGGGVVLGSLEDCTNAVLNGTVLAYLSDVRGGIGVSSLLLGCVPSGLTRLACCPDSGAELGGLHLSEHRQHVVRPSLCKCRRCLLR